MTDKERRKSIHHQDCISKLAVVRMVQNLKKEISKGFRLYGVYPVHAGSYHEACTDILKALAARGRK